MTRSEAIWPYSTHDELSHLAIDDVLVLRARIDMLLEERRLATPAALGSAAEDGPPARHLTQWGVTPTEERILRAMAAAPQEHVCSKFWLHDQLSKDIEPDTDIKIVDVYVCKIRNKLKKLDLTGEPEDGGIKTHWGRGYSMSPRLRLEVQHALMVPAKDTPSDNPGCELLSPRQLAEVRQVLAALSPDLVKQLKHALAVKDKKNGA